MKHKLVFLSALTLTALFALGCLEDPVVTECTTDNEISCKTTQTGAYLSLCVGQTWVYQKDCPNGCDGDDCKANDTTTKCTNGASQCASDGKKLQKCVDGEWKDGQDCPNGCEGNKCKDKTDDPVTDNVCTDGKRRCGSDGKTPELCESNAWKPQSACENGCIGDGECRICQEGAKSCDADGKRPRVCKNNSWEDQAICKDNLVCVAGECVCPEGWQNCEGAEGCFDLANDANNCGACGNAVVDDNYACKAGKVCVANGGGIFPKQPAGECCDPNAKKYVYLADRPDCQNAETDILANKTWKQFAIDLVDGYSYQYCLTESDIQKYYPDEKDTCFALKSEVSHLVDDSACGILGNYTACDLKNSHEISVQACSLGRCCLTGTLFSVAVTTEGIDKNKLKGSDCCSGYAYHMGTPNGSLTACTDDPNECKDSCGSDDCKGEYISCKML